MTAAVRELGSAAGAISVTVPLRFAVAAGTCTLRASPAWICRTRLSGMAVSTCKR